MEKFTRNKMHIVFSILNSIFVLSKFGDPRRPHFKRNIMLYTKWTLSYLNHLAIELLLKIFYEIETGNEYKVESQYSHNVFKIFNKLNNETKDLIRHLYEHSVQTLKIEENFSPNPYPPNYGTEFHSLEDYLKLVSKSAVEYRFNPHFDEENHMYLPIFTFYLLLIADSKTGGHFNVGALFTF